MSLRTELFREYMMRAHQQVPYLSRQQRIMWATQKVELAMRGKEPAPISSAWLFDPNHFHFRRAL